MEGEKKNNIRSVGKKPGHNTESNSYIPLRIYKRIIHEFFLIRNI